MKKCPDFYPLKGITPEKEIILKVSDFRSAYIQAKMLAKRGLWISEFRVESGLNCGGHAFATDGFLMGPILEEFKQKRTELAEELWDIYALALQNRDLPTAEKPQQRITVYGRENLLADINRPNLFINELNLYLDYLKKDIVLQLDNINDKKAKYYHKFSNQLQEGINYYKELVPNLKLRTQAAVQEIQNQLLEAEKTLGSIRIA